MGILQSGTYRIGALWSIITLFSGNIPLDLCAQTKHQEATVVAYNIGFGGITSGIGAGINKPKDIKWHKAFARGFWQGSVGGLINYSSKKTLHLMYRHQNTFYALPATILNAAGYSIKESASLYKPFLQYWCIDYGPIRINFSTQDIKDLKVRFLPQTIYGIIDLHRYGKLDLETSLLTGIIAFRGKNQIYRAGTNATYDGYNSGRAFFFADSSSSNRYHMIAHEVAHYYQYREYQVFNCWLQPLADKIKSPVLHTVFSKYIYLDLPHFLPFYLLEGYKPHPSYYKNFFEFEAERFAKNEYVPVR